MFKNVYKPLKYLMDTYVLNKDSHQKRCNYSSIYNQLAKSPAANPKKNYNRVLSPVSQGKIRTQSYSLVFVLSNIDIM